jgi:hypothetical protein
MERGYLLCMTFFRLVSIGILCAACADSTDGDGRGGGDDGDGSGDGNVTPTPLTVSVIAHRDVDGDQIIVSTLPMTCEDTPTIYEFSARFQCPGFYATTGLLPVGRIAVGAVIGETADEFVQLRAFGPPHPPEAKATTSCPEDSGKVDTITVDALTADTITVTLAGAEVSFFEGPIDGTFEGILCADGGKSRP